MSKKELGPQSEHLDSELGDMTDTVLCIIELCGSTNPRIPSSLGFLIYKVDIACPDSFV